MTSTHLSPEQRQQFDREGYLVIPGVFDAGEVRRMQREADKILELIVNSSIALQRTSGRLDWLRTPAGLPMIRKIQPINDLSAYMAEVSSDPRLLDPMRDLMDDEPVLMEEKLNYKQPLAMPIERLKDCGRPDDRFPVHNDWAYYKAQSYPQEVISSALTLDPCTAENGPIRVWPGSHKKHLEHETVPQGLQVLPHLIDLEGGADVLAPAGSVMFFHSLLVHNSTSNNSGLPRRLMIYSHYPKRYEMGHDVRNGPTRVSEGKFEQQYREMVAGGHFADIFHAAG